MTENVAEIIEAQQEHHKSETAAWAEALADWASYWDEEPDDPAESP